MRPWGNLNWLFRRLKSTYSFDFVGSISTEDRSISAFHSLENIGVLKTGTFFEIEDPIETQRHKSNRNKCKEKLKDSRINLEIINEQLLCSVGNIYNHISRILKESSGSIALDISTLPKRFFFPLVKLIMREQKVENFLVTYSTPEQYSSQDLSESPMEWAHIPMFDMEDPDMHIDIAIVGLGFMHLGLSSLLKDKFSEVDINLLFPFPPGSPSFQRTWSFIEEMNMIPKMEFQNMARIDALNVGDSFDKIMSITNNGERNVLFAPYGPKPMSLAMCIYACKNKVPVYYTQPTCYDSKYSEGTAEIYGYFVKLNGRNLF